MRLMTTPDYTKLMPAINAKHIIISKFPKLNIERFQICSDGAQEVMFISQSSQKEVDMLCALLGASGTFNDTNSTGMMLNFGCCHKMAVNSSLLEYTAKKGQSFKIFDSEKQQVIKDTQGILSFDSYVSACRKLYNTYQGGRFQPAKMHVILS